MRIYGNRPIKTLDGQLTRPTSGKVREALFNIWQGSLVDCRWLDLCAGNGSMGAEALCRGAKEVIGIEQNGKACGIIQQNWQAIATDSQSFRLLRGDILTRLPRLQGEVFDRIYFDPPYQSSLYTPVLKAIATYDLLAASGEIAVEHDPQYWQAEAIGALRICRQKSYGHSYLTFYRLEP